MKRVFVPVLFVIMATAAVMEIPSSRESTTSRTTEVTQSSLSSTSEARMVNYKGVSFSVSSALASEIRTQTIPEHAEGKPSDVKPEHPAFTLVDYTPTRPGSVEPHIRVFGLKEFKQAMAVASLENKKSLVSPTNAPEWTIYIDEELRSLKAVLKRKPTLKNVRTVISKARRGNEGMQMPFLPLWEAHQAVVSRLRYVDFKNGKGVFFLTQWDTDTSLITNAKLTYAYQGITNDGRYYLYAEFPVNAPFLPKGDEPDVIEWTTKNYLLPHESMQYQKYVRPLRMKLEMLPADQFEPNLDLLERLIRSLEVMIDKTK